MARSVRSKKHLVWIDCEMTGLDPATNALIEIATIITNYDLEIIARGPVLPIRASETKLAAMDAWNRRTHKQSGLLDRIREEGVSVAEAERQTLALLARRGIAARGAAAQREESRENDARAVQGRGE